jgi:prepilin-type N-terminal cleavage/methylation domain-containing protein
VKKVNEMRKKGFTLIEMLIVIAVIGVLAVAVLSAINPVEQMRKARDTRRRSNAAELLNALERYYATFEQYPTDYSNAVTGALTFDCTGAVGNGNLATGDLASLITAGELKTEFSDRIADPGSFVYGAIQGGTDLATVCYQIESQANITNYSGTSTYCESGANSFTCVPE